MPEHSVITSADQADEAGPLTRTVLEYARVMEELVPTIQGPDDWAPVAEFLAVDEFERIGVFLEKQDWAQYAQMMTGWATAIDRFETTVHRITEVPGLVYFEIEERHFSGDHLNVVNSLTVFAFDDDGKIHHLDVFLQQPR